MWTIPTLLGAVTLVFLLMRVLPGDIAMMILMEEADVIDQAQLAALREQLGLNVPLWQQYLSYIWGLARFDLGTSVLTANPVWHEISIRLPYTLTLVLMGMVISIVVAIPVGALSAIHQDSWIDYGLRSGVIAGISIPNFWLALLILMFMLNVVGWSAPIEYAPIYSAPLVALQQLAFPAITLGYRGAAINARMMRSSMLEVLHEDYIRTARAKGLTERVVIYIHAARNAILPVVTTFGLEIIFLLGGSVIIEKIFNVPGIGRLLIDSIQDRDYNLVQGIVSLKVILVVGVNLMVDMIYAWADPRIRYR